MGPCGATGLPAIVATSSGRSGCPASPRSATTTLPPASAGASNISSKREPGPIGTMPAAGWNSSLGWPSMAITLGRAPTTPTMAIRDGQALTSRNLIRAPGRTSLASGAARPFTVTSAAGLAAAPGA